ncbi:hypothetical protein [Caulobacter sp. NIBR1757]|uniref:hypothetical protein n=1 Tax=Caulobacter sp. NIBR1757 TaxID=3016000 RepID=UPI0022F026EB|nr:hypothetical protein [Caulobacter sp. NIBR1757]WGM38137.1 hypothetical protein AMEJIAPC_01039 [Caulobacter sp. NIBR1757]
MAVVTGLSLLFHVGLFTLIGLNTPGVRERPPLPEEVIDISLFPPRVQPAQPAPAEAGGNPANGIPRRDTTAPMLHVPAVEPPSQVAPSPLPAPAPAGASAGGEKKGGSGRGPTIFPSPGEDTRKALRGTYGCAYPDATGLNRREREACSDRPVRQVSPIAAPIPGAKRKAWDQVAAKQQRDREWRENPTIPTGTSEEQGPGYPAGVGPGSPSHAPIKTPF